MIGGFVMQVDDVTLQSILNTYGKGLQVKKNGNNSKKDVITKNKAKKLNLTQEELSVINYSKNGKLNIDKDKKQSLIDFFQ
jgi:hypothetical protein